MALNDASYCDTIYCVGLPSCFLVIVLHVHLWEYFLAYSAVALLRFQRCFGFGEGTCCNEASVFFPRNTSSITSVRVTIFDIHVGMFVDQLHAYKSCLCGRRLNNISVTISVILFAGRLTAVHCPFYALYSLSALIL